MSQFSCTVLGCTHSASCMRTNYNSFKAASCCLLACIMHACMQAYMLPRILNRILLLAIHAISRPHVKSRRQRSKSRSRSRSRSQDRDGAGHDGSSHRSRSDCKDVAPSSQQQQQQSQGVTGLPGTSGRSALAEKRQRLEAWKARMAGGGAAAGADSSRWAWTPRSDQSYNTSFLAHSLRRPLRILQARATHPASRGFPHAATSPATVLMHNMSRTASCGPLLATPATAAPGYTCALVTCAGHT